MNNVDADRTSSGYELKDELARLCLATARREPERKLAWVNSVCILFLLIGLLGARQGVIAIRPVPPVRQEVPVVVQPAVLPPQPVAPKPEQAQPVNQPRVLVVLPNAPNVNFGVPSAGTLVADAALASAPQAAPVHIGSLNNTGAGGERPEPPYPPIALQTGEQGTIVLVLTGDDAGHVVSVDVKTSSGFPVLDHATVEFLKRHWRLPTDSGTRLFQTSITYKLQLN
ncbi:MAG TPA: TonB family protein [Candidatus Acidoferrales bacterium]|nr:TonB family protein [Candidatus Acidoferrales bacterium]